MINHRERQLYKAMKENRACLFRDVTQERFKEIVKTLPPGSIWLWSAQCVYGPIGSALLPAEPEQRRAAE
jgi:hypothetical protein